MNAHFALLPGDGIGPEISAVTVQAVEAAGGKTENIGKITVYLSDIKYRSLVNKEWVKMFPNETDRPSRHVVDMPLRGKTVIQLDVIAMV